MLAIGRSALCELIWQGEITPIRIGRSVRFTLTELERFVTARAEQAQEIASESIPDDRIRPELLLWLQPAPGDLDPLILDPGGVFDAGAEALGRLRLAMHNTPPVVAYAPGRRWEHVNDPVGERLDHTDDGSHNAARQADVIEVARDEHAE